MLICEVPKLFMVYSHLDPYSIAPFPVQALENTVNEENLADLKYQFNTVDVAKVDQLVY